VTTHIRRCTSADIRTIAALGARLFVQAYGPTHPEPDRSEYLTRAYSDEAIAQAIDGEGNSVFIVEDDAGEAIGYAHICVSDELPAGVRGGKGAEIVRFYVDAAQQGRGIGASLMRRCCDDAEKLGADVVWLQTWSKAPWAIGFYTRMGFSIVGEKPFYFGARVDRDHLLARRIKPEPAE
jgi:ribosomal protein S18 acetylase RimI-like enzyme